MCLIMILKWIMIIGQPSKFYILLCLKEMRKLLLHLQLQVILVKYIYKKCFYWEFMILIYILAHVNLKEENMPFKGLIAQVILDVRV